MKKYSAILLGLIAIALYFIPTANEILEYNRNLILINHQYYRIITGHFVHFSVEHLFWDVSMYIVLGTICCHKNWKLFVQASIISTVTISVELLLIETQFTHYRGLSGIDTALYSIIILDSIYKNFQDKYYLQSFSSFTLGGLLISKITYEFISNKAIFANSTSFVPLPSAHFIGLLIGIILCYKKYKKKVLQCRT